MTNVAIKDLFRKTSEYANKEVTLEGWTKTIRDSKTFGFIELTMMVLFLKMFKLFLMII